VKKKKKRTNKGKQITGVNWWTGIKKKGRKKTKNNKKTKTIAIWV